MAEQTEIRKVNKPTRYAYQQCEADLQQKPTAYPYQPIRVRLGLDLGSMDGYDWDILPDLAAERHTARVG